MRFRFHTAPSRHHWLLAAHLVFVLAVSMLTTSAWAQTQSLETRPIPPLPISASDAFVGSHGEAGVLIAASASGVYVFFEGQSAWQKSGGFQIEHTSGNSVSTAEGLICVGGTRDGVPSSEVTRLRWDAEAKQIHSVDLPSLPTPIERGAAAVFNGTLYVTDGQSMLSRPVDAEGSDWQTTPLPVKKIEQPALVEQQGKLYLFGEVDNAPVGFHFSTHDETLTATPITSPPQWLNQPGAVSFGLAHIMFFGSTSDVPTDDSVLLYHTITDTWIELDAIPELTGQTPMIAAWDGGAALLSEGLGILAKPAQLITNYGWIDNLVVAAYLLGMIGIGWYFTKRESSSNDFFRGGQRIPWWAAGMSLFATGASAISLAGMPGMGFGTDWTYFTISICSAICLPIGIFIMAPLVRKLQIKTANEYLERRFGVTSRMFASVIFMFSQVAARIASVMLLSAIALEAITDMDIVTAIIIMGVVTTLYTFLGGLEAVIWTDTVQGFVMVATVIGCLLLAFFKLDQPVGELWSQVSEYDKTHMFDFSTSIVGPTTYIFLIHTLFLTFGGISDQNFVQRVQSTPNLNQTKLAVATQMAVAVPINILLFSLGTMLWLFYRSQPDALSPTIVNNDGVFPFFAAQQLPIGVSGIVVAALLAATMSTVSSSICAVSDLGTNDFYRRFKSGATDHQCLVLGRILTAVVGVAGTLAAIVLAGIEDVKSVWDLAIMVTGLISSSVLGLFMLGLLTRRTHEVAALVGAAAGMATIIYLKNFSPITFWLYIVIGPIVTITVGYLASFVLPGTPRETKGLTLFTMEHAGPTEPVSAPAHNPRH